MKLPRPLLLAPLVALALAACNRGESPPPASGPGEPPPPAASAQAAAGARCARRGPARLERAAAPGASSSVELVRAGGRIVALVADADERAIHAVDAETMREVGVTPLPGRPGHVLALADGRVAVAIREGGRVMVLEPADEALAKPFEERCAAEVAVEPWALADGGERLFVASGAGAALTVLGAGDLAVERVIRLPREPRAVLLANGGATAFVTHAVGGVVSAIDLRAPQAEAEAIRLHAGRRMRPDGVPDDARPREASQGYALASVSGTRGDGARGELRIFAPHASVDPGAAERGVSVGYGGGATVRAVTSIVSVLDPVARRSITNHVARAFDELAQPECLLPRSAVADEAGLFVACLDLDAVVELDPWIGDPVAGERRRIRLPAGPSALALAADGGRLFVWSEIDRALSRVERAGGEVVSTPLWRRAGAARDAKVDRGRRLFHTSRDARLSQGRACASCHPEGRDDGLVWTSPDGPRQTLTLAGRLEGTAPYGWSGESPTVKEHLRKTFSRIGGTGLDDPDAAGDFEALLAYVAQIPPPPAAPAADARTVERGKKAFVAYCNDCHKDGGTDGQSHDVGSGLAGERSQAFDTPSLRGVRGSAPYFHDGRYATLEEVLAARDQKMFQGVLSEPDRRDLLAYLETLPPILAPSLAIAARLADPAAGDGPPPGWETPPPLTAPAGKRLMPAGCSADRTCRERQLAGDATPADRVTRLVDVRFADLPALVVREAPEGGPSLTGAPGLRFLAGAMPAPWPYVPRGDGVRAEPLGAFGEITWGGGGKAWLEEQRPFHREGLATDSPSFGAVHTVPSDAKDLRSFFTGRVSYTSIDEGPGGSLTVDYVTGELAGTPELAVSRWGHADAAALVDRYVHAFQGRPSDEAPPGGEGGAVTFVLPSAWLEFEAKDAKHAGGFMRIGNTTRGGAYSSFTLPAAPGRSGIVSFRLAASEIATWIPQPPGAERPPQKMQIVLASSQTSVEAAPRVRVMFYASVHQRSITGLD